MQQWERLVAKTMARTGLSRPDAEDVVQDVTERVLSEGLSADVTDWFHYVAESAKNRATDEYRRARAAERRAARAPRAIWLAGVPSDDVAEAVVARLDLDAAYDAVDTLPELTAQVFLLRVLDGLKPRQIAEQLDLTPKQVAYRLDDAKRRLLALQEQRRSTQAFALLAVLLRPGRKAGTATTSVPAVAAAASAAALSVLTMITIPAPHAVVITDTLRVPAEIVRPMGAAPVREGVGARRDAFHPHDGAARPPAARPVPRPAAPSTAPLSICVGSTCVGGRPAGPAIEGDVIVVNRVGRVSVGQRVTPLCWLLPDNPEVTCTSSGDPGDYHVPRPGEEPAYRTGNTNPSPPAPREPTKGTSK